MENESVMEKCSRCGGLLCEEIAYCENYRFPIMKCINCGNAIDRVIEHNRSHVPEQERQRAPRIKGSVSRREEKRLAKIRNEEDSFRVNVPIEGESCRD